MTLDIAHLAQTVEKELFNFLATYKQPEGLYQPIQYALEGGGKRLRPVLTLLANRMVGGREEEVLPAAIALEIFHNFTLLHDDVMYNSLLRRGRPSVPAEYGLSAAILSGDAMFALAYKALMQLPREYIVEAMRHFTNMSIGIMEGQQWDMDFEWREKVAMEEYIRMIHNKTAVLLGAALQIGGYVGGASTPVTEDLYQVGIDMGIAFQLKDDYLDVYGDEKVFGKPIGGDIEENKKTWLLIKAREIASLRKEQEVLELALGITSSKKEKYDAVRAIYDRYEIDRLVKKEILFYSNRADKKLLSIPNLEETSMQLLQSLIHTLAERSI